MRRSAGVLGLLAIAAPACGAPEPLPPPGQVLLHFMTDAPLPPAPGEVLSSDDVTPLFDRILVEVFAPGDDQPCEGCTREFDIDRVIVSSDTASVGFVPPPGATGYRVRARLFFAAFRDGFDPPLDSTIELTVALPVVGESGIEDVTMTFRTDAVGVPGGDLSDPASPERGLPSDLVGTWPGARRRPCPAPPSEGEVCIPGGAYWMGRHTAFYTAVGQDSARQRLVVLAPFYLDAHETTVKSFRDMNEGAGATRWSGTPDGNDGRDWCTLVDVPGERDALPIDCVSWDAAVEHCHARSAELPTEAQYEYAASDLGRSTYVWGYDDPGCTDSVFARSGAGLLVGGPSRCRPPGTIGGPLPPDRPDRTDRDQLRLPTGTVFDLAGNVNEWTRDVWNRQSDPCWIRAGVYLDPLCETPSLEEPSSFRAARAGSWMDAAAFLQATTRLAYPASAKIINTGFRCARPAIAP